MAHTQSKKSAKPRRNFHNPQQNDSELLDDQVVIERNHGFGFGFAETQKFRFLPKPNFNRNQNRNPSFYEFLLFFIIFDTNLSTYLLKII